MKVLVLGGDGFCGWPLALHLSAQDHEVLTVDNLSRRKIDIELGVESLTPVRPVRERLAAWKEVSGKSIRFEDITIGRDFDRLVALIEEVRPDAIVHFAEQRAAPYSMKSARHKRYTVRNNLNATNDVLAAIAETGLDIHLVHLGTMGLYGYAAARMNIPEDYLKVKVDTNEDRKEQDFLSPANSSSIYHMTKMQNRLFFHFYNENDGVKITDLHQGIVWGSQTDETRVDDRLINRFDYDGDYGTVLNRFLMQAAGGHPLTVHGAGGQTRAFIHIRDTVRYIKEAIENPPESGQRVRILNQMTETHRVRDLAQMIARLADAKVAFVPNPRNEADSDDLHVANDAFRLEGAQPIMLEAGLMEEITEIARTMPRAAI